MATKADILKSIRSYCVETCCAGDEQSVRECPGGSLNVSVACPLHPYRFSSDPNPSEARVRRGKELSKKMLLAPYTGKVETTKEEGQA